MDVLRHEVALLWQVEQALDVRPGYILVESVHDYLGTLFYRGGLILPYSYLLVTKQNMILAARTILDTLIL
jgi:hypothetical protein